MGGVAFASASTKTTAKPAERSSTASASAKKITQPSSATDQKGFVSYKVRSGDSLYSISKKYTGGLGTAALAESEWFVQS